MSIKEQVLEILKKNYVTFNNPNDSYTFFRAIDEDVIDKIQAIPDEVTLREVVTYCASRAEICRHKCLNCNLFIDDRCYFDDDITDNEPTSWNIDAITKAIRGK
jgi:hypothetical protein